ncbi:hypothetical protein ABK905_12425 [Acerihabitans sp. KWT182]|uniref:Uncharacterized protein n=1 Tax=Acerihabitans sp. KWT182 TaxID=3157919 RepID=A0AAU7QEL6_9GAMM
MGCWRHDHGIYKYNAQNLQFFQKDLQMTSVHKIFTYNERANIISSKEISGTESFCFGEILKHLLTIIEEISTFNPPVDHSSSENVESSILSWIKFLCANQKKLDPIIRLNTLFAAHTAEDHEKITVQFIIKNTGKNCDSKRLTDKLLELIKGYDCQTSADLEKALYTKDSTSGEPLLPESFYEDMCTLYHRHFFRNTSKLGLDFFASRGYDIVFNWDTGDGSQIDLNMVKDKHWQREEYFLNEDKTPFTFSEIRHVLRNKQDLFSDNIYKISFGNNNIEIAKRLDSETWVDISYLTIA